MTTAIETAKPDREQASQFLTALFGRYFQENDGWVELRFISAAAEGRPAQAWCRQGKLTDENWTDLTQLNQSAHVFMGVNPRTVQSGCAVDIESVVCLWADIDGKDEGKEAALKRANEFPVQPSILVDSGHGYHCYWLLKKPLLAITDEVRLEVRRVLKGLSKSPLKSDGARIDISSCLRLPGTMNVKAGVEPVKCGVVYCHPDTVFALSDFAAYRDAEFREPEASDEELPQFGKKDLIVSPESEAKAFESVDLLQVPTRTKTMILTGKAKGMKDNTNSGRDFSIICTLVMSGYGYSTIKSIFFNPHLKCANRVAEKGEGALKWDVRKAVKFYEKFKVEGTPQSRQILAIKRNPFLSDDEKLVRITEYVVKDLLTSPEALGTGFYEDVSGPYYFFHTEDKTLMDLESVEFENILVHRYQIDRSDTAEVIRSLRAEIMHSGQKVESRTVHYFDAEKGVLYVDNGANQFYRLDGKDIKLLDNGSEGVFFGQWDELSPFEYLPDENPVDYFRGEPTKAYARFIPRAVYPHGFSWKKFFSEDCYLNKFLVSRASFAALDENKISPNQQKLLLVIYFYTLFFESIFTEKPVAAFIGKLQSGKSFLATSIGKIIFGPKFERCSMPDSNDSLKTVFHEKRFVVLDDVKQIPRDMKGTFDAYATGRPLMGKREPYKKRLQPGVARVFYSLTSVEMKGWDDQFMRRVLLFNTKGLTKVEGADNLWEPLLKCRDRIMTEILVNLNSIVALLNRYRGFRPENPPNITATWSSFGQKVTSWFTTRHMFRATLDKLVVKKGATLLDIDPMWQVLEYELFTQNRDMVPNPTAILYKEMVETAKEMKIEREFQNQYKDAQQLGIRLSNAAQELAQRVTVTQQKGKNNLKLWGFKKKKEDVAPTVQKAPDVILPEEPGAWTPVDSEGLITAETAKAARDEADRVQAEAEKAKLKLSELEPGLVPAVAPEPPAEPVEPEPKGDETKRQGDGSLLSAARARVAELTTKKEDPPTE